MLEWDAHKGFRRGWLRLTAILGLIIANDLLEIFTHMKHMKPVPVPFHAIALCFLTLFTIDGKHALKRINNAGQREQLTYLLWVQAGLLTGSGLGTVGWIIDMLATAS